MQPIDGAVFTELLLGRRRVIAVTENDTLSALDARSGQICTFHYLAYPVLYDELHQVATTSN